MRESTRPSTYEQDVNRYYHECSTWDVLQEGMTDLRRTDTNLHPSFFLALPCQIHDPTADIPMKIHVHWLADARTWPLEGAHLPDQGYNGWQPIFADERGVQHIGGVDNAVDQGEVVGCWERLVKGACLRRIGDY